MAHAANTRLLIKRSRTGRVTNDGTASAWEPGGLMARGLHTRGIDTPSGWPRVQRRPGRRGRPATACAHALPTATPSPRAVRGWGRARARRAGKAGCPPRTAPGHRPSSPGLLPSGPRRPRGFRLACCDARAPGMASGTFHQAPPASRGPCGWGSGWRTPDRLISVATGGTRLGPGAPVLPQVPDGGSSAASVPWCVHSTRRWAPTACSAEARAGDESA